MDIIQFRVGLNPGRGLNAEEIQKWVLTLPAKRRKALAWHPPGHPCLLVGDGNLGEPLLGHWRQHTHTFLRADCVWNSGLLIIYLNEVSNG